MKNKNLILQEERQMKKYIQKYIIGFSIVTLLLAGCNNTEIKTTGRIDTEVYSYYSQVNAEVKEIPVSLGQTVKAGDIIVLLDDTTAQYNLQQAQQTLIKAQHALAQVSEAVEPENIQQSRNQVTIAQQNYNTAKATFEKADRLYQQQYALFEAGSIAKNTLQDADYSRSTAEATMISSEAQLDSAKQQLALLLKKQDVNDQVKMAETDVKQAENQIANLTDTLEHYTIRAAKDGTILSLSYREGAIVSTGSLIADTSIAEENYWIGYVNSKYANQLQYGQQVKIKHDDTEESAEVCYMDLKTQYAPDEFQSSSNRNQQTIKVKCRLSADSTLLPGQEATMSFSKHTTQQENNDNEIK